MTRIKMLAIIAILVWGWFFYMLIASAATLKGNQKSCEALASVVMQAGELRASGVPWEVFDARLDEMITEARGNPDSFVQSDDDVKFIKKSMKLLWNNPQDAPILVASAVYQSCMGK